MTQNYTPLCPVYDSKVPDLNKDTPNQTRPLKVAASRKAGGAFCCAIYA